MTDFDDKCEAFLVDLQALTEKHGVVVDVDWAGELTLWPFEGGVFSNSYDRGGRYVPEDGAVDRFDWCNPDEIARRGSR